MINGFSGDISWVYGDYEKMRDYVKLGCTGKPGRATYTLNQFEQASVQCRYSLEGDEIKPRSIFVFEGEDNWWRRFWWDGRHFTCVFTKDKSTVWHPELDGDVMGNALKAAEAFQAVFS